MGDPKEELEQLEAILKAKYPDDEDLQKLFSLARRVVVAKPQTNELAPQIADCLIAQNTTLRSELECRNTALHLQKTVALQLSYQLQLALADNNNLRSQLTMFNSVGFTPPQYRFSPSLSMGSDYSSTSSNTPDYQQPQESIMMEGNANKRKRV